MTKWSNFIRNLGTAGPDTFQGIRDLGFALVSDFPTMLSKYLRVDAAQTFSAPEKAQGRTNLGLGTMSTQDAGAVAITGGSIAGITDLAIADGGTGAGTAPAARTNLGLGNVDNTSDINKPISTATQTALNLKAPLASPPLTGTPTAPTAAPGTNTTQLATTAFVNTAVAGQSFTKEFISAEQTITNGGLITLAHGLAVAPKMVFGVFICKTAEFGYSVGDKIVAQLFTVSSSATDSYGMSAEVSGTTNILLRYGATGQLVARKDTGVGVVLTNANWRLIVEAWA